MMMKAALTWLAIGTCLLAPGAEVHADVNTPDKSPTGSSIGTPRVVETEAAISILLGDQPVLTYHKSNTFPPAGIDQDYSRSGYIHPIYSPRGSIVTGHYAPDHPHQTGLFNAWVNTTFRGHTVDFWNRKANLGWVAHRKVNFVRSSPERAEFSVELDHVDISQPEGPVTVLHETWHVTVHAAVKPGFIIDLISTQRCATADPLIIHEYRYGGMAIRGCDEWFTNAAAAAAKQYTTAFETDPNAVPPGIDEMNHDFLTSEAKGRFDGNHSRPNWVDLHGVVDGQMSGIAIMNHDQNFRSPQTVRLNPSKPYFCFAPNVNGTFEIVPGKDFVSRYRLLIHDGPPRPAQLDRFWTQYQQEVAAN